MFANFVRKYAAPVIIRTVNFLLVWLFNRFDFEISFDRLGCPYCYFYQIEECQPCPGPDFIIPDESEDISV